MARPRRRSSVSLACVLFTAGVMTCLAAAAPAVLSWKSAVLRGGAAPAIPLDAVSGGEVFVEATVGSTGQVTGIAVLRTTPPFTQAVVDAVGEWRFQPAEQTVQKIPGDRRSIVTAAAESKVLVACIYRQPSLHAPATLGQPPADIQPGTRDVAVPLSTALPAYPPLGRADGVVVVEARIGVDGRVARAAVVRSVPGFDQLAMTAAWQWTFRPARIDGRTEETFVYLVFAFRQPVT